MKNLMRVLLVSLFVVFGRLAFAQSVSVNFTINNVGTNAWTGGGVSFGISNYIAQQSYAPATYYWGASIAAGYVPASIAAGGTYSGTWGYSLPWPWNAQTNNGASVPVGGSVYYGNGGTWPNGSGAGISVPSSYMSFTAGNPSASVYHLTMIFNVAQNTPCLGQEYATLADSYTNMIYVTYSLSTGATNDLHGVPLINYASVMQGPLSGAGPVGGIYVACATGVTANYSNIPPCLEPLVFSVTNTASTWRIMAVGPNPSVYGGQLTAENFVAPSGFYYYSNNVPCGTAGGYQLYSSDSSGGDNVTGTGITNMVHVPAGTNMCLGCNINSGPGGGSGASGAGGANVTNNPPSLGMTNSFLPSTSIYTNQIIFSNTNDDMGQISSDIQQSGQAVWSAVNNAALQAHSDAANSASQAHNDSSSGQAQGVANANGIINAVNAFHADNNNSQGQIGGEIGAIGGIAHADAVAIEGQLGNMTNPPSVTVSVGFTNYNLETTQTKVLAGIVNLSNSSSSSASSLIGISNLLAGTNSGLSGSSNGLMMSMASAGTNVLAANAAVASAFSAPLGYLDDVISSLGTVPDVGGDTGAGSEWQMDWLGIKVNFDPVAILPIAFTFCYGIWSWLLVVGYLVSVSRLYIKCVQILSASQTGGVPDLSVIQGLFGLSFGEIFGGNFIGVIVAVVVPSLIMGLWVAAVTFIITPLGTMLGAFSAIGSVFDVVRGTQSGAMGLHILFNAFPVGLLIQLVSARLVLQFTMARVLLVAVAVSRYLFGK